MLFLPGFFTWGKTSHSHKTVAVRYPEIALYKLPYLVLRIFQSAQWPGEYPQDSTCRNGDVLLIDARMMKYSL
jgi:hypothetical protein